MWQDLLTTARTDKRRTLLVAGGAVLLILLIILFVRSNNKQRILAASLENLREETSYHAKANLDLDLPTQFANNRPRPIVEVTFDVEGDMIEQENGQPLFMGRLRNEARGRGMVLFADGELRLLANAIAFRLESLPALLNPQGNLLEKWTYVEVPAMETKNPDVVREALRGLVEKSKHVGAGVDGTLHYNVMVTSDDENTLIEAFRQANSGNRALHIITRLLRAFDLSRFDVYVDQQAKEVRRVEMTFVQFQDGNATERARLTIEFSDYGKAVTFEEPPKELTVRPDVFGRIFGSGEIEVLNQQ